MAELDVIEAKTPEGIDVRVYTEKGRSELGRFALECGVKTLSFFAKFFEVKYPLPKLDMIAVSTPSTCRPECNRRLPKRCREPEYVF